MSCASCAHHVEMALQKTAGVTAADVNLANHTVAVTYLTELVTPRQLRDAVENGGYELIVEEENPNGDDDTPLPERAEEIHRESLHRLKVRILWAAALSLPLMVLGMFYMHLPYANYIMWAFATPVVFVLGREFYLNAWKQARHRSANMDTLVALSTGIAYLFSVFNTLFADFWLQRGVTPHVYFEASAVIVTFILTGRWLEERAKGKTSQALKKLMGLQPNTVTVVRADEVQETLDIARVTVGDILLVKPGEKIAVDGMVTEGNSYVDESTLTGEPVPVLKLQNDAVFAGTLNQKGSFRFIAQKVGADTLLSQIIRRVEEAQGSKAPVQKMVDKIAAVFVPVVLSISLISFAVWMLADPTEGFSHGLLAMVTVLVIACPCALGLATPTAIMVGMGKGAQNGILIKNAEALELTRKVTAVVMDKTGTLTAGEPTVTDLQWYNTSPLLPAIFRSLENASEHPLAEAITRYLPSTPTLPFTNFFSHTGQGVQATFDSVVYYAGNRQLLEARRVPIDPAAARQALKLAEDAKTVIWFANAYRVLALAGIADRIKETSLTAVQQLHKAHIQVYMLTGDHEATARVTARRVGITHYKAQCLPKQKIKFIKQLQAQGQIVAMAGDGINDSAALAQADVGIAMGKGSDIAMEAAEMTLISSDLLKIPEAIRLSKLTVRTIRQNLFWAFIYNLIGIPIAAGVLYPFTGFLLNPMIAGAAMALSSVSVVSNSLRLYLKSIQVFQ